MIIGEKYHDIIEGNMSFALVMVDYKMTYTNYKRIFIAYFNFKYFVNVK